MEKSLFKGNNKDTETKSKKVIIVSFLLTLCGHFPTACTYRDHHETPETRLPGIQGYHYTWCHKTIGQNPSYIPE